MSFVPDWFRYPKFTAHVMDDLMPPVIPRAALADAAARTLSDFAHDSIHQSNQLGTVGDVGPHIASIFVQYFT